MNHIEPVPEGYIHRPIIEFFTGLSCSYCMEGPHQDLDKLWEENVDKPEEPFTFVVFHQLNGGQVDDLATDESRERMRHYQPQISSTPDAEFDGGYIRLGGLDASDPVTHDNAHTAVEDCKTRYERQFDPWNPRQMLRNEFKFVDLYVKQVFTGEGYAVSVQVHYRGMDTILFSDPLQGSLYVFMIEDNVTAYSTVLDENISNHNVFRGYAIEDEQFTLSEDEWYETIVEWEIPTDAKVPIKPGDLTAVAAVYDLDDTDSQNENQGNNVNVPRCIQSATPKSTAFDLGNDLPTLDDITITYDSQAHITAQFDDDDGISMAYVLYNTEAMNSTSWNYVEMTISGEEICDETGACYAYANGVGTVSIPMKEGEMLYYMLLIYDGNATEGKAGMFSYKAQRTSVAGTEGNLSIAIILMIFGVLLLIVGFVYILMERKREEIVEVQPEPIASSPQSEEQGAQQVAMPLRKRPSKNMMIGTIILGIILISAGAVAAVLFSATKEVPDIEMKDVEGNEFSLSDFRGKVVFLEFMATWCSDCQKLTKEMKDVYSHYGDDIVMISLDIEHDENPDMLKDYADKNDAKWIFAFPKDINSVLGTFSIHEIPKSLIIDKDGYLTFEFVLSQDSDEIIKKIEATRQGAADPIASYSIPLVLLAFATGIASFFSPCSFPMLPGYVGYYLGLEDEKEQKQRKEILKRALPIGIAAALGLLFIYLFMGLLIMIIGAPIYPFLQYMIPVIAVIVIILGLLMLTNIQYYFITNRINSVANSITSKIKVRNKTLTERINEKEVGGIFVYGMGYGLVAAGCTLPLFLLIVTTSISTGGFLSGMLIFFVYGLGAAILMVAVTLLVALSKDSIINKMKMSTEKIKVASGLIMIIAGIAVLIGFYVAFLA
ncbi:MAG: sulfite exporter TauE/SafE family protein [Thermoplasmata archaeon]|nr:MAG: sulfite exporter TauE/SafE family protein [Thermoplasmata archaeon]